MNKLQVSWNLDRGPQKGGFISPGRGHTPDAGQVGDGLVSPTRQYQFWKGSVLLPKSLFLVSNPLILFIKPRESQKYSVPQGKKIWSMLWALLWASGASLVPLVVSRLASWLWQSITKLRSSVPQVTPHYCGKFSLCEIFYVQLYSSLGIFPHCQGPNLWSHTSYLPWPY